MIGYGDRARTQCEVVRLFRETHPDLTPLNQGTISKIEAQYREMGHVRKVPSKRQVVVDDDTKLNLLLALEENPIIPARQLARDSDRKKRVMRRKKGDDDSMRAKKSSCVLRKAFSVTPRINTCLQPFRVANFQENFNFVFLQAAKSMYTLIAAKKVLSPTHSNSLGDGRCLSTSTFQFLLRRRCEICSCHMHSRIGRNNTNMWLKEWLYIGHRQKRFVDKIPVSLPRWHSSVNKSLINPGCEHALAYFNE
ncbi:hypothetical protein NQ318_011009 [Aromia moschata]|uniref:DUF4817 domain-containing protein n=1 Tax=Aromia moschata TaxID=1265417 RepID=A0AAV8YMI1_9CUCU|nr:hypothetical protein NQ318_011009 [Aromia moschata]